VWCDTDYAFYGGAELSIDETLAEVERIGGDCRLIELTGGEPLLQKDIGALAQALLDRGYTVLCETSGSLDIGALPELVIKIMDIKCPGSGETHRNRWENLSKLGPRDEIKFVIRDRADFDWALEVIEEHGLMDRNLLFSPVWRELQLRTLAEWMLESAVPARLQTQLHKHIWSPAAAGV
jgi:7-carboxy-7-deazaguanine synthase